MGTGILSTVPSTLLTFFSLAVGEVVDEAVASARSVQCTRMYPNPTGCSRITTTDRPLSRRKTGRASGMLCGANFLIAFASLAPKGRAPGFL